MAAEVHGDLAIPLDRPVDVFAIVERMGLVLAFAPLGGVSGMYLPDRRSPGILLHEGHPRTRQRYTAGHELGHHVFGHAAEVDADLELALQRNPEGWPDHEKEAEAFGAWLLMPRRLIRKGLQELGIKTLTSAYDVYALSLWLGTSYTATVRQLSATRLVSYPVAERWARIPPKAVKQSLAGEYAPDDLHNDVWWLDGRRSRLPIDARPGDRLVLTLDEIPSTGYSWEFTELPAQLHLLADSFETDWEPRLALDAEDRELDVDGQSHPRSFVLEIDPSSGRSEHRVDMVKERSWSAGDVADRFEMTVRVNPPLHGVQLPERELAFSRN